MYKTVHMPCFPIVFYVTCIRVRGFNLVNSHFKNLLTYGKVKELLEGNENDGRTELSKKIHAAVHGPVLASRCIDFIDELGTENDR